MAAQERDPQALSAELEVARARCRELESTLSMRDEEVRRLLAEVDQFAYVVSHDLQEPLRMVTSYVQLLARRYRGRLDASADTYIGFAVEGSTRMQTLLDDLLLYSRLSTRAKPREEVDLGAALRAALAALRGVIQERGAEVSVDPLPVIAAEPTQMPLLFQQLIDNAIKFCTASPPRIRVSADRTAEGWRFTVADNGIGIPRSQHERVFSVFQRLHPRGAYSGNGMGLTIARRIIQLHGGRIGLDSEPDRGTTVWFTIPCEAAR